MIGKTPTGCNVGPALIVGGPFLFLFLSPLGLYVLWAKHMSSRRSVFLLLEQKTEAAVCVFFLEQKNRSAGCFSRAEKSGAGFLLESSFFAAEERCSSRFFFSIKKT